MDHVFLEDKGQNTNSGTINNKNMYTLHDKNYSSICVRHISHQNTWFVVNHNFLICIMFSVVRV